MRIAPTAYEWQRDGTGWRSPTSSPVSHLFSFAEFWGGDIAEERRREEGSGSQPAAPADDASAKAPPLALPPPPSPLLHPKAQHTMHLKV
mmetsp:Transcript_41959/g.84208  ORF Transcript_41959/g.84208 Transcript_41959/m.84208 type:complete len:90 (-) Transcript_41959:249-518(-)|eukprot:CAMPEP_0174721026 /NCGR_PEP_ID=MMETSP1094-20130205/35172_1 /TAXON_ID=156173 /ORGANISM="Chrysochromulina brevifilum, Strain UTEX LB 985" /LENGTH=89 /DNA_ID=CAMNT_0015921635 /DNA_START=213 /DNA_END=482 /DNA_ORIENTATION=+